jgi:hypothetical protein
MCSDSLKNKKKKSANRVKKSEVLSISDVKLRISWIEAADNILTDFFNNVERRRRETKKANKPPPLLIKNLDDIARLWEIINYIANEVQCCSPQQTYRKDPIEEELEEILLEDEEYRLLKEALHDREQTLVDKWIKEEHKP